MNSSKDVWAAPAAIGLLIAAIMAGLMLGASAASAAPQDVTGGSLVWGVKASFASYITGPVADGEITLSGGASDNGDGTFTFAPASGTADSATGAMALAFGGAIQFTGHDMGDGPLLDFTLSELTVDVSASGAVLSAHAVSKSLETGEVVDYGVIDIANLDFSGVVPSFANGALTFSGVPATITEAAVPAFEGMYEAGDDLDPVTISIELAAAPTATPTETETATATATATATTTATATPTTPAAQPMITLSKTTVNPDGDTITVTGSGFLPSMSIGTRPPFAGQEAGFYVAFGAFADNWRPSEGAPSSARPTMAQDSGGLKWVIGPAGRAILGEAATVLLNEDGTFTATITVQRGYEGALADGNYGIYTYPGSGAVQPLFETFTPVSFTTAPTSTATTPATATTAPKPPTTGDGLAGSSLPMLPLLAAGAIVIASAGAAAVGLRRRA